MGILNSIPGWLLRGENRHAMRHLYEFHRSGLAEKARVDPARASQPTHPWFGIESFPEQVSLEHIRALAEATLLRPEPDTRVTGYKEIRWYDDDLPDFLAFLRQVFPGARFVLNTRNLEDVAASNYWTHKDDPLGQVQRNEAKMLAAAEGRATASTASTTTTTSPILRRSAACSTGSARTSTSSGSATSWRRPTRGGASTATDLFPDVIRTGPAVAL